MKKTLIAIMAAISVLALLSCSGEMVTDPKLGAYQTSADKNATAILTSSEWTVIGTDGTTVVGSAKFNTDGSMSITDQDGTPIENSLTYFVVFENCYYLGQAADSSSVPDFYNYELSNNGKTLTLTYTSGSTQHEESYTAVGTPDGIRGRWRMTTENGYTNELLISSDTLDMLSNALLGVKMMLRSDCTHDSEAKTLTPTPKTLYTGYTGTFSDNNTKLSLSILGRTFATFTKTN